MPNKSVNKAYLASLLTKHSGGKYQYVPAPCDVSSIEVPSWESSIILDKPKSVIFASPISSNKMFAVRMKGTINGSVRSRQVSVP